MAGQSDPRRGNRSGRPHGASRRRANGVAASAMPPLEEVFRNKRILLTGATGFLGKVFLQVLLRHHPEIEKVHLLIRGDRRSSLGRFRREIVDSPVMAPLRDHLGERFDGYIESKVDVVPGDITSEGLLAADAVPLERGTIDAVVHSAGLVNFEASLAKALDINTIGVAHVLDFCRRMGAAMLHVSTCYVAGAADGHRYEDDVEQDWCPDERRSFHLEREIEDARAAIARVEAESREQLRLAELGAELRDGDAGAGIEPVDASDPALEKRRKQWVEERLKEVGKARARSWGWPNTYSYTKSLGEQLVLAARRSFATTVVRPAVIESSLADPFPGWNQGVNTSAPLAYLSAQGYRFFPARAELVLDVIPVDLVAHAMVPVLAALLCRRQKPVYQLCTSDRNPLPMRRLIELTGLANREDGGAMGALAPHLEAVVVSQSTYDLASEPLPRALQRVLELARGVTGEDFAPVKKIAGRLDSLRATVALARELVEIYRPYIQELAYTFHGENVRSLYAELRPADAAAHPFHPEQIDWRSYWVDVHFPGLRRHIFPQLDQHTRSRSRAVPRYATLVDLLDRSAERYGSDPALVARKPSGEQASISYRELRDRARRAATLLAGRGVKPGDRVLLIAENSPDWALAYFAIVCSGAVAVPLDHLISADELVPICRIAEPRAALRSAKVARRLANGIKDAAPDAIELELAELSRPFVLGRDPAPLDPPERKALASIVFTSGTTGAAKGVMLTHGNFTSEVAMLARVFPLSGDDALLSLLPLHHTFEFTCGMLLPLASGATIVYPLDVDAKNLSRALADVRPSALIGVPALWEAIHRRIMDEIEGRGPFFGAAFAQLRDLNRRVDRDYGANLGSILFRQAHAALGGRLRLAVSGGAALPHRVAEFFNDIGIRLLEGYGLTEAAPVLCASHPGEPLCVGSVGKPLDGVEIRLDPPSSEVGEIVARGPNVMLGYYRNPSATGEVLRDGWLHTGDLGRFDAEGRLAIVGRAKEVIVDSGGNNIYIDELEEAYGRCDYLKELAVVGLAVGQGEQVAALAVPAYARGESRRVVEDRLRAHFDGVSATLSPHKRIRILRFTDQELPRTRTRKIKRPEIVATLTRMLGSDDEPRARVHASSDVEPWLAQALSQVAAEPGSITASTRLIEDLGLDSLALAELVEHITEHTGREIAIEEVSELRSVGDLQSLVAGEGGTPRVRLPSYARFAEPFVPQIPQAVRGLARGVLRRAERGMFEGWLKPRILGRGNVPANRNLLVVANHASHLDFSLVGYALGSMSQNLVVLAAKDYFFNTPARRFIFSNFTSLIPFDRERAQLESLEEALAELGAGRSVLMFPEGTRSPDGAIHDFKSGAGYLALRSGCDVLPVLIRGTRDVLGKGTLVPHRRPVEVRIGRVVEAAELRGRADDAEGMGAYRKLADFMRAQVVALAGRGAVRAAR